MNIQIDFEMVNGDWLLGCLEKKYGFICETIISHSTEYDNLISSRYWFSAHCVCEHTPVFGRFLKRTPINYMLCPHSTYRQTNMYRHKVGN